MSDLTITVRTEGGAQVVLTEEDRSAIIRWLLLDDALVRALASDIIDRVSESEAS